MAFIEEAIKGYEEFLHGGFIALPCKEASSSFDSLLKSSSEIDKPLILTLKLNKALASPIDIEEIGDKKHAPFTLHVDGSDGIFSLPSYRGTLKFYFKNYKDYFYLPMEGRAIHSSVGQFVDKSFREKAKKETAFEPAFGIFYPQQSKIILPEFKASYNDNYSYFRLKDIKSSCEYKELAKAALEAYL